METSSSRSSDAGRGGALTPALFAAAILLPPLAIFLADGVSRDFWIGVALTCLGYLPGMAFAFYALLSRSRSSATS